MAARWEDHEEFDPDPPKAVQTFSDAHKAITGERREQYGHPLDNHSATAAMWRAYLHRRFGVDIEMDAEDVCFLNVIQKVSREAHSRKYDNKVDIVGFIGNIEQLQQERSRRDTAGAKTDSRD